MTKIEKLFIKITFSFKYKIFSQLKKKKVLIGICVEFYYCMYRTEIIKLMNSHLELYGKSRCIIPN